MKGSSFWMVIAAMALLFWLVLRSYLSGLADAFEGAALQMAVHFT